MQNQLLSFYSITPHLKNLRVVGYYQIDPNAPVLRRRFHRLYQMFILFWNCVYTVQEAIKVFQVRDDPDKVMDTLFLMLTYSDNIFKQVVLRKEEDKIDELLDVLKGPLFNQNEPEHQILLLRSARQARLLLRAFNITALCTCTLWVVYPMILYAQQKPVEFSIWLPIDPNNSLYFCFVIIYVWLQTSLLAYGNTSMDAFVSVFYVQCKTQLSILRIDLKNIVKKSHEEAKETSTSFAQIFHRRFNKILMHYDQIVQVCYKTQNIFGGAIMYLFLVSGWIICTSVYRMVNINPISVEFTSMILYVACILTELIFYCYFGNEVTHESQKLMQSAFGIDWQNIPLKYRYSLIVFMERIKRPIVPMAGAIIPLSNNTLVSILRSSYSFYAFLKNSEK